MEKPTKIESIKNGLCSIPQPMVDYMLNYHESNQFISDVIIALEDTEEILTFTLEFNICTFGSGNFIMKCVKIPQMKNLELYKQCVIELYDEILINTYE